MHPVLAMVAYPFQALGMKGACAHPLFLKNRKDADETLLLL